MKKKALLSSILTIALCLSLIAGSTFALFTSESKVNVAVTAGKVNVVATIENVNLGTVLGQQLPETQYAITNGNELALTGMVPGDYITFDLKVANNSDVTIKYRTILKVELDNGLWEGLEVTIGDDTYNGQTKVSEWTTLTPADEIDTVHVKISLPKEAGNDYQEKTCTIAYTVEAVQGNASVADSDADTTYIYTVNDLMALASNVAANNTYYGKTVLLMNDIDLAGSTFNGIGADNYSNFPSYFFNGTFDGQNYTIRNMTVSNLVGNASIAGFFNGLGNNAIVKNIKFENATITSNHEAGVVAGYCVTAAGNGVQAEPKAYIENCHVNNSVVTSVAHKLANGKYDDGDKVGGIIGLTNFDVKNCSVKNTKIIGVRDLGGIVGATTGNVTDCTIGENVSIMIDFSKLCLGTNVNSIVGRNLGTGDITAGNSGDASISKKAWIYTAEDLSTFATNVNEGNTYEGVTVLLEKDIDLAGYKWIPIGIYAQPIGSGSLTIRPFMGTFDGQDHTISNMKTSDTYATDTLAIKGAPALFGATNEGAVIKNLTVKNALVWSNAQYGYASAVVGSHSSGTLTISGVSVENSTICAGRYVGGFVGIANRVTAEGDTSLGNVIFTDCAMKNIAFYYVHSFGAESNVYGVLSNGSATGAEDVTQTNITVTNDRDQYYSFQSTINE